MFKEMGVKNFYIGKCIGDSKRATVMFDGPEMFYITFSPVRKQSLLLKPLVISMKEQKLQDGKTIVLTANFHLLNFLKKSYLES